MKQKSLRKYGISLAAALSLLAFVYVNLDFNGVCCKPSEKILSEQVKAVDTNEEGDRLPSGPNFGAVSHILELAQRFLPVSN